MGGSGSKLHKVPQVESKWFPEFEASLPSLENKTIAVTGCTSGTGFIFARTCVRKKAAQVLLLNRASERATKAEEALRESIVEGSGTVVTTIECDLQSIDSVNKAINTLQENHEALDVLCNNAGVMALEDKATGDGYDVQMQTNHISHFLLTKGVFSLLKKAAELRGEARVVNHSSLARNGSPLDGKYLGKNGGNLGGNSASRIASSGRWERYHQTKLANVVFTLDLADRVAKLSGSKIKSVAAAPGFAATNLQVTASQDGGMDDPGFLFRLAQSAEDGTMPLLHVAFGEEVENGDFWEPGKWNGMFGPPKKTKLSNRCTDEGARTLLWEASEAAVGKFEVE